MLPWYQYAALIVIAFLFGSIQLGRLGQSGQIGPHRRWRNLLGFAKGFAACWIVQAVVAPNYVAGWTLQLTIVEQSVISLSLVAVLFGDRFPIGAWFDRRLRTSELWAALLGGLIAIGVGVPGRASLIAMTIGIVAFLLILNLQKNIGLLLPLLTLIPVGFGLFGKFTLSAWVAYGLFIAFLFVELLRLWRPAFNRRLIRIPGLLGERELNRPLAVSGAVSVIALLVDFIDAPSLAAVVLFGIVGISVARALAEQLPFGREKLWRDVTRGLLLSLVVAVIILLPLVLVLTGLPARATIFAALAGLIASVLPIPVDRYILAPLAAAGILALLA